MMITYSHSLANAHLPKHDMTALERLHELAALRTAAQGLVERLEALYRATKKTEELTE